MIMQTQNTRAHKHNKRMINMVSSSSYAPFLLLLLVSSITNNVRSEEFDPAKKCYYDRMSAEMDDKGIYAPAGPIGAPFLVTDMPECMELCKIMKECCRARYLYGDCVERRCQLYGLDSDRSGQQAKGYQAIECGLLEDRDCQVQIAPEPTSCFVITGGDDKGADTCHGA
uniref:Uncharacterized protein n=1 Tax=Ditylum brightwellii TaxID=49249 RepID=A0A6U3TXC2_9STRA|mmetsp:Transcript_4800/g.6258  ORF Transcript_4800/g.6258 Transcript_4800/m.6258 type:complete len:170 (+) Transcript_4800:302-811(+)